MRIIFLTLLLFIYLVSGQCQVIKNQISLDSIEFPSDHIFSQKQFIVAGVKFIDNNSSEARIQILDKNGTIRKQRRLKFDKLTSVERLQLTDNNQLFVSGYYGINLDEKRFVSFLDSDLNIKWTINNIEKAQKAYDVNRITSFSNNLYLFTYDDRDYSNSRTTHLLSIDKFGNVRFDNQISLPSNFQPVDFHISSNGIVLVGRSTIRNAQRFYRTDKVELDKAVKTLDDHSDPDLWNTFVAVLDFNGKLIRYFLLSTLDIDKPQEIISCRENYLVSIASNFNTNNEKIKLINFDIKGNVIWKKEFQIKGWDIFSHHRLLYCDKLDRIYLLGDANDKGILLEIDMNGDIINTMNIGNEQWQRGVNISLDNNLIHIMGMKSPGFKGTIYTFDIYAH